MRDSLMIFPPPGFVGRGSASFPVGGLKNYRIASIHLRPTRATDNAHLWRLTFEWEISPQPLLIHHSGVA